MTGTFAEDGLDSVVLSLANGGLDPFAVELADSGLDLCSLVLGSIPDEGLDPVLPPSADEDLDCSASTSAEEGLVDSCSSFLVAALGSSATVSTDDGFDPFSAVSLSCLLVASKIFSFVLVAEFAPDPFVPSPFAELGLDPSLPPFSASDKAASVFADAGRGSSS